MKRVFLTEGEADAFAAGVQHLCTESPVVKQERRAGGFGWYSSRVWVVSYDRADQLQLLGIDAEEVARG